MTSTAPKARTSTERMREHRRRMREKGYVQKTIWVPDMSNPEVRADYQRQAKAIGDEERAERELDGWLDAVRDWPTDEWPEYAETDK